MSLLFSLAAANDFGFQAFQCTGLLACCNRYGLVSKFSSFMRSFLAPVVVEILSRPEFFQDEKDCNG